MGEYSPLALASIRLLLETNRIRSKNAYYVKDKYLAPKALRDLNAYCYGMADKVYAKDLSKKSPEEYTMLEELANQKKSPQVRKHEPDRSITSGKGLTTDRDMAY